MYHTVLVSLARQFMSTRLGQDILFLVVGLLLEARGENGELTKSQVAARNIVNKIAEEHGILVTHETPQDMPHTPRVTNDQEELRNLWKACRRSIIRKRYFGKH